MKKTAVRNPLAIFGALALILLGTAWSAGAEESGPRTVGPGEFFESLEAHRSSGSGTIIDVRTPGEYQQGHAPGALNIDYYDPEFRSVLAELDRDEPYYIYCQSGNRSGRAIRLMADLGFREVYDLAGGWSRNAAALLAVEGR